MLRHLPTGKVRHLRLNSAPKQLLTDFAVRVWDAIVRGKCRPTARAVAAYYGRNKDTAARALKQLQERGLLWRSALRSAGRKKFVRVVLVTDEHYAWDHDAELRARLADAEAQALAEARADADEPWQPELDNPQLASCPTSSDGTSKKLSEREKDLSRTAGDNSPVDNSALDRHGLRLARLLRVKPELQEHLPQALALLHGLGLPPMDRAFHARTVAQALRHGWALPALLRALTSGMGSAKSRRSVLLWRLKRLSATLRAEPAAVRG